ncbi:reticulocalbin-2 isoform X1 [Athene noctua]|uniref:reticulocalbin-2 isoform X1 n=1 Tax=Athene noctua TaxID=126797 RepID=UPI003EB78429
MRRRRPLLLALGLALAALGAAHGQHRADYDREALLGGQEEAEEYARLSPEEQQRRLRAIVRRIDSDADGLLSKDELSSWIQQSFKHYVTQEAKQHFNDYDKDGDGLVSWKEYNMQMYDRVIDFDENTVLEDQEEESFRQVKCFSISFCKLLAKGSNLHLKEKKRFEKANRDDVPDLNVDEFVAFEHPEEVEYMTDFVIQEALEEHDKDGDGFVSLEEFLGDYRRDPTAREDPEWILVEKDRFVNDYDKDNDGKLNPQELLSWIVPNNQGIAQEEALHLIEEMDLNDDKKLSEAEILKNQDLFLNSEATDYGRQLHDERFYHEEL